MNWDRIKGNWKQFKGEIRSEWGELTDDEVAELVARSRNATAWRVTR